nr:MAG TPA: AntA/AntB antirepressor [Caudoviricetes sp.]
MLNKFNKRQLVDQCGFTVDEAKVILEYQKKLPILSSDNSDVLCVNARDLFIQLNGKNTKTKFIDWAKYNITKQDYSIGSDYEEFYEKDGVRFKTNGESSQKLSAMGVRKNYMLSLEFAKEISMYCGTSTHASIELRNNSKLTRKYFILMEKAVKKNCEWELIRYPLRQGYKQMQKALDEYMLRKIQKNADEWDYRFEADALNIIATGFKAQEIRLFVGCQDTKTRDSLTATYNEYLLKLQELNIIYLGMDMNRYERYKMLKQSFDILFPDAVPIKDDTDINRIRENKERLLSETREKIKKVA